VDTSSFVVQPKKAKANKAIKKIDDFKKVSLKIINCSAGDIMKSISVSPIVFLRVMVFIRMEVSRGSNF